MSVPGNVELSIEMKAENWAFGNVVGKPRLADLDVLKNGSGL